MATYTIRAPSGEMATACAPVWVKSWLSGSMNTDRATIGAGGGAGRSAQAMAAAIAAVTSAVSATGIARLHSGSFCTTTCVVVDAACGEVAIVSSSARRSPTACQRRFGFFSRHRFNNSVRRELRFGGSAVRSASRMSTEASTSGAVSPRNGCRPVSISYRTTPSEKTSLRWSARSPFACSGAM